MKTRRHSDLKQRTERVKRILQQEAIKNSKVPIPPMWVSNLTGLLVGMNTHSILEAVAYSILFVVSIVIWRVLLKNKKLNLKVKY